MVNGNFADYGQTFSIEGRYTVKERVDLFSLLPVGASYRSILEVGCADGTNLQYFAKCLNVPIEQCVGLDICDSPTKSNKGIHFIHSPIESYILSCPRKFDLILLSDVLEHLYNPWKVLSGIKDLLNPFGHLLISVPNLQNLNYLNAVNSGDFFYQKTGLFDETHIRFFSEKVLKKYLLDAGFSLVNKGWRPDQSLQVIENDIRRALNEMEFVNFKIGNLIIEISKLSIDGYFGQQVLMCATHE